MGMLIATKMTRRQSLQSLFIKEIPPVRLSPPFASQIDAIKRTAIVISAHLLHEHPHPLHYNIDYF